MNTFVKALIEEAARHGARVWFNAKICDVLKEGDAAAGVRLDAPESARQELRDEITTIVESHMAALPELWREIVDGKTPLSVPPEAPAPAAEGR